jgi:hypothetical protein
VLAKVSPAVALTESFVTVRTAAFGEVLRGVSFTPGTHADDLHDDGEKGRDGRLSHSPAGSRPF